MLKFSYVLKNLLQEKGITQETLAKEFFTTQQTVSRWLNGINEPDFTTLNKLADYLGCSVDYLLGREDDYGIINNSTNNLTKMQLDLLSSFDILSTDDQNKVLGFIKGLENK